MNKEETKTHRIQEIGRVEPIKDAASMPEKLVWWLNAEREYELGKVISETEVDAEISVGERRFTERLENLHKANPSKFDLVDNMAHLSYLNEPSILHNLRQRYLSNMQYTYSGLFLVAINPYKNIPIYTKEYIEKYSSVYKREDAAPHIYAVASEAYHLMRNTRTPQSILITGESGAGKTENTKYAIAFLTKVSGDALQRTCVLEERLISTNPLLEAFGNAQTGRNDNSSRFGKFIKIEFGMNGEIVGASVERYLLESSRVTKQAAGERNYHIFYALTKQADESLLASLRLERHRSYKIISSAEGHDIPLESICASMGTLGFSQGDISKIFRMVAAIIHLGEIEFVSVGKGVDVLGESAAALENAAALLDVDGAALKESLLRPKIQAGREVVVHGRTPEEANFTVSSLCKVLYERLFDWIVSLVNVAMRPKEASQSYIGVLDIAGFEILDSNGFEQLCINYTNEKLQQFFNHRMFILEQDIYMKEGLEWNMIDFGFDLQPTIDLLEKNSTGIFSILDEECVVPGGNGSRLLEKISRTWKEHPKFSTPRVRGGFTVEHYAGKVKYHEDGWISKNKDPLDEDIAGLLLGAKGPLPVPSIKSGLAATRFRTVTQSHKEQLSSLLKMLYTTNPHFVRCILPNRQKRPNVFEVSRVLHQLRCNGVLEGVRISRQGFPTRVEFREFTQRYALLSRAGKEHIPPAEKGAVALLTELGVPPSLFRLGRTRLFLRQGVLADLEEQRNAKISVVVSELQRRLRILLEQNIEALKKAHDDAVSLLQRNVKIYASVRNWSWWKLCMKVRPLLEVRKAEDEIKERDAKIAALQVKLQDQAEKHASVENEFQTALQEAQRALAKGEDEKQLACIKRNEAEAAAKESAAELAAAQRASNKYCTQVGEMQSALQELQKKAEQARRDAASEVSRKLMAELDELKAQYEDLRRENKRINAAHAQEVGRAESAEQERDLLAQEKACVLEKSKKLSSEIEELQNEVTMADSLRRKGEVSAQKLESEVERLGSLLSFEKEKVLKLNEAFKKAAAPAPEPVRIPVKDNTAEILQLQKDLEHERERATARQAEYEDLKKEYINLVDEKLGSMISEKQKTDAEMKKLHQSFANSQLKMQEAQSRAEKCEQLASALKEELERKAVALAREEKARRAHEVKAREELLEADAHIQRLAQALEGEQRLSAEDAAKRTKAHASVLEEVQKVLKKIQEMHESMHLMKCEIEGAMKTVVLFRAEIQKLAEEIIKSEAEKECAMQKLGRATAAAQESESALDAACAQIQRLVSEKGQALMEAESEAERQREALEEAETAWQAERRAMDTERREMRKIAAEKKRLVEEAKIAQAERARLQERVQDARSKATRYAEEKEKAVAEAAARLAEAERSCARERAESARQRREVLAAQEALARVESDLKRVRSCESARTQEVLLLEARIVECKKKEAALSLEVRRLKVEASAAFAMNAASLQNKKICEDASQ
ncbi:myosin heavy chain 9/10/11/14 [Nematocida major]|uniref:myosin heavy chain 9/10/11/14 n=1 Tax=Nematocida major TaxID=1912982 RepID=UPI00200788AF|nr:myosin heavy chain 9/10/11/14 [Nematocida major]KAH9385938.1 myosin heavy chain 9/10/11/14 [Nematocida major]